jgi:multisubunit Na+/H+ antiporter MnhB subunit
MKLKNIVAASAIVASSVFAAAPVMAASGTCPEGSIRASYTKSIAECNVEDDDSLISTINTIINVIIGVLGLTAVIIIVLGGVQFVTSTGDPGKVKKAKDTILYGIIGLVVAILAFAIVNFVLSTFFAPATTTPAP